MILISLKEKSTPCPYCQNLHTEENYAFGADFPAVTKTIRSTSGSLSVITVLSLSMRAKA